MTSLDSIYRNDLSGLQIAAELYRFVEEEALPGSGVDSDAFWSGAARLFEKYKPMTRALLVRRDELQSEIDNYYLSESKEPYEAFLRRIGTSSTSRTTSRSQLAGSTRGCQHRRAAARRPDLECTVCHQCRQRAMGLVV